MQQKNGRKSFNLVKSHEAISHFIRGYLVPLPSYKLYQKHKQWQCEYEIFLCHTYFSQQAQVVRQVRYLCSCVLCRDTQRDVSLFISRSKSCQFASCTAKMISILYQFGSEGGDQNILVLSRNWVLMLFQGMPSRSPSSAISSI